LARNKVILKNKLLPPSFVVAHAMGKMVEYLNTNIIRVDDTQNLDPEGELWMAKLDIQVIISTNITQRSSWQLRISVMEFHNYLSSYSGYTLYFDGASKGNLEEVVVSGGVVYRPR
jgi:hypothetical protein